jgi:hypothetical protein
MPRLTASIALAVLLAPLPGLTHHSAAGFYDEDVVLEIEGVIVAVLGRNPHVSYTIRTSDADGREAISGHDADRRPCQDRRQSIAGGP